MKTLLLLFILVTCNLFLPAQDNGFQKLPYQSDSIDFQSGSFTSDNMGNMLYFWVDHTNILFARSPDGENWSEPIPVIDTLVNSIKPSMPLSLKLESGRLLLIFKLVKCYSTYSDDDGLTWSAINELPVFPPPVMFAKGLSLIQTDDHWVRFLFNRDPSEGSVRSIKSQTGEVWTTDIDFPGAIDGSLCSLNQDTLVFVFEKASGTNRDIFMNFSTDGGIQWSTSFPLLFSELKEKKPRLLKDSDGVLWLLFNQEDNTIFPGITQYDAAFIKSSDGGVTWSPVEKLSRYKGNDSLVNISLYEGNPYFILKSEREKSLTNSLSFGYFGKIGYTEDIYFPPKCFDYKKTLLHERSESFFIKVSVDDYWQINKVSAMLTINVQPDTLELKDDGTYPDSIANDGIFTGFKGGLNPGDNVLAYLYMANSYDSVTLFLDFFIVGDVELESKFLFDINKLKIPVNNWGVLADINIGGIHGGYFDDYIFLFSGGFYLSGYNNQTLWGNGVFSSPLVADYFPGLPQGPPFDPNANLFVQRADDPPFNDSWYIYQNAVELGAPYYDGNNDGIYNPIDLNANGIWDKNEDRPDQLGDVSVWSVFSDNVPSAQRRFSNVQPQGIAIQQTVFAYSAQNEPLDNIIFIRYRLINTGIAAASLDDVYFSIATDPDLGDFDDDLAASDTLNQSGIAYNDGADNQYGFNSPAFFSSLLQGPAAYIPGETFIDNNNNGIYDPGTDTPIDTAYYNLGELLQIKVLPGARNQSANSYINYLNGFSVEFNDPENEYQLRNNMLGKLNSGELLDPCTATIAGVYGGVDCSQVNPLFWFSGDPVENIGWIYLQEWDQRMMLSVGPFDLNENEPVDIIAAYIVGRGSTPLNSVTEARSIYEYAKTHYTNNFPTGIENSDPSVITEFILYQNYPNPFNPVTNIKYQVPSAGMVTLKVYDILGSEVAVLVNKEQSSGIHELEFNAKSLASGVYFYKLTAANNYSKVNKMMILK